MNEIKQAKEIKQFATGGKVREIIIKEITPTVQKIEGQCNQMRNEIKNFKENYGIILRFEQEKHTLQKSIKEVSNQLYDLNALFVAFKGDSQITQTQNLSIQKTFKNQLLSFDRTMTRRDQTIVGYDKKLNGFMENISKHQLHVEERLTIYEERFKRLSKETFQITKDVKRDFDNCMIHNQSLKNELLAKIGNAQKQENILNLYMTQRQQMTKRIVSLQQGIKNFVNGQEFDNYKRIQEGFIKDSHLEMKKFIDSILTSQIQDTLKITKIKFAELDQLKLRCSKMQDMIKNEINGIYENMKSIEVKQEAQIAQIRVENQQAEERVVGEMEKRFETIEDNIEQRGTQTQGTFEEKLKKLRQSLEQSFNARFERQALEITELKAAKTIIDDSGQQKIISEQLQTAKRQRQKIESYGEEIKKIAQGLNDKLNLFSNKITMYKSDIQLFVENTRKQLKKINTLKTQMMQNMDSVGKLTSSTMEAIIIILALQINQDSARQDNLFATYQDGLILEVDSKSPENQIIYRRNALKSYNLKESLLYCLLNLTDQYILLDSGLKWEINKPSEFFKIIKDNIQIKNKTIRSGIIPINTSRRRSSSKFLKDESAQQLKIDDLELCRANTASLKSNKITVSHTTTLFDRPSSELQRAYKMKKQEQLTSRKQGEDRSCFTASRSHRKKVSYL